MYYMRTKLYYACTKMHDMCKSVQLAGGVQPTNYSTCKKTEHHVGTPIRENIHENGACGQRFFCGGRGPQLF